VRSAAIIAGNGSDYVRRIPSFKWYAYAVIYFAQSFYFLRRLFENKLIVANIERRGGVNTPVLYSRGPEFNISAWRLDILTEDFREFFQYFHANAGIVP
jgi:hypothetical protein